MKNDSGALLSQKIDLLYQRQIRCGYRQLCATTFEEYRKTVTLTPERPRVTE